MKKKPNECFKCKSWGHCSHHVFRLEEPYFNEIACDRHIEDLFKHADEVLGTGNGIFRTHRSSTGSVSRNDATEADLFVKKEFTK